jgi:hypothetical protein
VGREDERRCVHARRAPPPTRVPATTEVVACSRKAGGAVPARLAALSRSIVSGVHRGRVLDAEYKLGVDGYLAVLNGIHLIRAETRLPGWGGRWGIGAGRHGYQPLAVTGR